MELEEPACDLCGSRQTRVLLHRADERYAETARVVFSIVRRRDCGLASLCPRPTRRSIVQFYPRVFYTHREDAAKEKQYEQEAELLARLAPGRPLDLGCANGGFVRHMHKRGWDAHGIDLVSTEGQGSDPRIGVGQIRRARYPRCLV
jgi:hypothetical protein